MRLLLALALLAPARVAQSSDTPPPNRPPNVVFIMVDDMGWADLGCYGQKVVATPNIDSLARDGMRFTQAYSGCVVCAPARSVLMTGKHMGHTSVRLNTGGVPLLDEDVTVAEVLRTVGYHNGGFGKWGIGDLDTTGVPEKQGFDLFYGYYHQIHAHDFYPRFLVRNGEKEPLAGNARMVRSGGRMGPMQRKDPDTGEDRVHAHDRIVDETLAFLDAAPKDRPFFCYVPWTPPHGEYSLFEDDPAWLQWKDRAWPMKARMIAAYNTRVDLDVGRVLAKLEALGIADETVVFFCSDHGADSRLDGILDSCGPFQGKKRSMHEGGIRVPLVARWPGHIAAGTVTDHLTHFCDVLPTLAELGGAEAPAGLDGISFVPTLLGAEAAGREQEAHATLYWEWDRYNWGKRQVVEGGRMQALRRGDLKAIRENGEAPLEIFDVVKDPGEVNDLAPENPELVAEFERLLAAAREPMRPQSEPTKPKGRNYR